jgi:hypothetical protein
MLLNVLYGSTPFLFRNITSLRLKDSRPTIPGFWRD